MGQVETHGGEHPADRGHIVVGQSTRTGLDQ